MVDDEDYESLIIHKWQVRIYGPRRYASRYVGTSPNRKYVAIHQVVMGSPEGIPIDHIDGDGLNNQKINLRRCTTSQNIANSRIRKDNKSGYKGVSWIVAHQKYRVAVSFEGKKVHVGYFDDLVLGAIAYDEAARRLYGEFAKTNF